MEIQYRVTIDVERLTGLCVMKMTEPCVGLGATVEDAYLAARQEAFEHAQVLLAAADAGETGDPPSPPSKEGGGAPRGDFSEKGE